MDDGLAQAGQRGVTIETIYRQSFRFVWRALARLGVPDRDLPDAVQDVFLVAHKRLSEFEGRSRVETWLYGIAVRVASDRRRLASARREVLAEVMPEASDDGAHPAASAERREGLALLECILDAMPLEQRAVFTLFEIDGVACEEIAEMVGAPIGTVYSRLRLARETFRKKLAQLRARESFQLRAGGPA
jgi:RNA polymerase sigma-70 factor (ECF subfamily)